MNKKIIKDKKIGLLGFGITNISLAKFLSSNNIDFVVWDDDKNKRADVKKQGYNVLDFTNEILDFVIISPGIKPDNKTLKKLLVNKVEVKTDLDLFFELNDTNAKYIGVTGTSGKTTAVDMLGKVFKDFKGLVGGNIGVPIFDLPFGEYIYILEVSSYQLYYLSKIKFDSALITNLSIDHVDWHGSIEEYKKAKEKIVTRTDGFVYITKDVREKLSGKYDRTVVVKNIREALCAIANEFSIIRSVAEHACDTYERLPHRLEEFLKDGDVLYVDDSKAVSPIATTHALEIYPNRDIYLLLGGKLRDKAPFEMIKLGENVKHVWLFGEAIDEIEKHILTQDVDYEVFEDMEKAIKDVVSKVSDGVVLFSPACPSFDKYRSAEERGEHFKGIIEMLKSK